MTEKTLKKRGIPVDDINTYIEYCDYIGNLQLLEAIPNIEKQNKDFNLWLENLYNAEEIKEFSRKHYIPKGTLDISNFIELFEKREGLIVSKLKEILQYESFEEVVKKSVVSSPE